MEKIFPKRQQVALCLAALLAAAQTLIGCSGSTLSNSDSLPTAAEINTQLESAKPVEFSK